jgi:hypothetical protein
MKRTLTIAAATLLVSAPAFGDDYKGAPTFEVTITNITPGQTFTPILAATHRSSISYFELGKPASAEIAELAESGSTAGLEALLAGVPNLVFDTASTGGLLGPGESITIEVRARGQFSRLSLAGMLIPTNDTFVALNNVPLPRQGASYTAIAYDAGSELNDELCANIPGPYCKGEGLSDENGEGFVHVSSGVHGFADLDPGVFDWRNPVAQVEVSRKK